MTDPASGRTADENEMREQIAALLAEAVPHWFPETRYDWADRLLSGPLAPILQEAATARKERDEAQTSLEECAALVSEYAAAAIPEGMEILAKDRDKWFDAAQAAEAEAAQLRAENANLRDRVREAEKGGRMSREAVADRMQQAFPDLTRLDAECAAEAAFPECLTFSPEPQEAGDHEPR